MREYGVCQNPKKLPEGTSAPLTDSQLGVYLECVENPGSCKYNIPTVYTFDASDIDAKRLHKAVECLVNYYMVFTIRIDTVKGIPSMVIDSNMIPNVEYREMSESEYATYHSAFMRPFDMKNGPYSRFAVIKTDTHVYLLYDVIHMLGDGLSFVAFQNELTKVYNGEQPSPETDSLFDRAYEEKQAAESGALQSHYDYFESRIGGLEVDSNLIPDVVNAGPEDTDKYSFMTYPFSVSIEELTTFTKAMGVSENVLFFSALSYALAKYTGQDETLISSIHGGRYGKNLANSYGMFVRTFPMYTKIDEEESVEEFVRGFKADYVETMSHSDASFVELCSRFGVNSDIKYVYQGDSVIICRSLCGAPTGRIQIPCDDAISKMDVVIVKELNEYQIRFGYRRDLYTEENVRRFADLYDMVVRGFVSEAKLKDIPLVSEETRQFINAFNDTSCDADDSISVATLLEQVIRENPDGEAVVYKDRVITYREFDKLTKKLASAIQSRGIGREDYVSIIIPHDEYMPITAFGVVRAGAAYQPLDPTYPKERLNFMIKDCGAKLLIADRELRPLLDEYDGAVLYVDEIDALPDAPDFRAETGSSDALVIIYTSGTTGTPKGCVLENHNIVSFFHSHRRVMDLSKESRVACYASFGFDAGVMDVFTTILAGGTLCVIPDEIRLDLNAIEDFYCKHKITQGFMTTQVGRMFAQNTKCDTLTHFMVGGEKLVPFEPPKNFEFINGYGPSETIAYVCHHVVDSASRLQPIGVPSINVKLYVRDKYGRLLPPGACGELCISGSQVGRGYLNRPEKTAEVFTANPYEKLPGYERLYHTGDVVRLLPTGEIDYVGRRDGQVKIRGFRVELTEVEQVIRSFKGIKDATVQAFDHPASGKYIAAYVVADDTVDIEKLHAYIAAEKPSYMVPAVTMQIDSIPLNANAKVDKRKLPIPEKKFEDVAKPETEIQQTIFDLLAQVVGSDGFGIHTDLADAGLTSIGSLQFNVLLSDAFSIPFQISDFKTYDTIEKLEQYILSSEMTKEDEPKRAGDCPLTKTQEGIFVECMSKPNSTVYNIPLLLKLDSTLNVEQLKNAIVKAVAAHPAVCTRLYTNKDGSICQKTEDLCLLKSEDIEMISGFSIEEICANLVKPFALLDSRLFRVCLIQADGLYLYLDMHHIISDGTSMAILLDDISKSYQGLELKTETFSGFDMAFTEQKKRQSDDFARAESYYETLLDGFDTDFLPGSDLQKDSTHDSGHFELIQHAADFAAVKEFCEQKKLSVNGFLCAAFGFVLAKFNCMDYAEFVTVYNGRSDSRTARTVSMLVKTLPVICHVDEIAPEIYVKSIASQLVDTMSNDIYSFAEISRKFGVKSDVMFIYQGESFAFDEFCGKPSQEIPVVLEDDKAPIAIQVSVRNKAFRYTVDYDNALFSEALVKSLISAFDMAVSNFLICENLAGVSLLDAASLEKMDLQNATEVAYDEEKSVVDIFRDMVDKFPHRKAITYRNVTYTYRELDEITTNLAAYLVGKGIGSGDMVSVLIDRNEYMPIASIGILKTGAAYQPLDPTYPKERLNFMVQDSEAKYLIADRDLINLLDEYQGDTLYTDEIVSLPKSFGFRKPVKPSDAFVIIYTSGTTGTPKGCILEHRNVVSFCHNHAHNVCMTEQSKNATYASFGFDAAIMDIFCTLLVGAELVVIPTDIRLDLPKLDEFFCRHNITHGFMTTQVGRMFASSTSCKTLKHFMVGGEKLVPFNPPAGMAFLNGYGPSECIAYVCHYAVKDNGSVQPIGKPGENTKLYIADKYGHRLPFGAAGELCIAGHQVGRGYYKRPDKTAEVFVANPFTHQKGYERMYRTGDVVRLLPDGNYDFIGRRDGQVKIRGFRVELTEIEQVIRNFKGIKNATVQAFDDPAGGKFIAAYIVADTAIDIDELNAYISKEKPPYMVPAVTMQIDEIPLNANSKVDKRKLPVPEKRSAGVGKEPSNEVEEIFCSVFEEVLGLDKVYADDDFFEIGGTSISAVQAVVKCENAGYEVVFKNLFENSTPEKLAAFVQGGKETDIFAPSGEEKAKYDYSALDYNVMENLKNIRNDGVGDVLLTGVTGFLGSHVFKELINNTDAKVVCLVRNKNGMSAYERFRMQIVYYFEDWYLEEYNSRVAVVDGDLSDEDIGEKLSAYHFDTILNCAANVKHFDKSESLLSDNFSGVEHLIQFAEKTGVKLVQMSSLSVCGESVNGNIPSDFVFRENHLNIGQSLENKYVYSKYLAEQAIIDAISRGRIRGKIIRLGNLMAREEDSEFQINAEASGFLKQFVGYVKLGCYPVDMMDAKIEFSPIDFTAKAVVLLAGTPDEFTVFHAKNANEIQYGYFVHALNQRGIHIDIVESDVFQERFKQALKNEDDLTSFTGFIAYMNKTDSSPTDTLVYTEDAEESQLLEMRVRVSSDTKFTTNALYRLGFYWPLTSSQYLERLVDSLDELVFFE